jgi:hypothetical protein
MHTGAIFSSYINFYRINQYKLKIVAMQHRDTNHDLAVQSKTYSGGFRVLGYLFLHTIPIIFYYGFVYVLGILVGLGYTYGSFSIDIDWVGYVLFAFVIIVLLSPVVTFAVSIIMAYSYLKKQKKPRLLYVIYWGSLLWWLAPLILYMFIGSLL